MTKVLNLFGAAGLYEIEELVAEVHDEDPLLEHVSNIEPEKHSEDTEGLMLKQM